MSEMGGYSVICSFYILETGFYISSAVACGESGCKQLFVFDAEDVESHHIYSLSAKHG